MSGLNLFTNNAATTLASSINSSVTSLTVASGTGDLFPSPTGSEYFYCTLANTAGDVEIVKVTARSTDTFTIVRAQDDTSALSWSGGDKVELRLVNANLTNFPQLNSTNTFSATQTFGTVNATTTNVSGLTASKPVFTDGSKNLTSSGTLSVDQGGTGATSLTANNVLLGNGTSAVQVVAPGTSGQVLTSAGNAPPTWTTAYSNSNVLSLFNASGSAPVYACRAWVNFDGGSPASINNSGNVSSVTYIASGVYGITLSTALPDTNYAITNCGWNNNQNIIAQEDAADTQRTTSYFQVVYETAGATKVNNTYNSVTVFR